MTGARYRWVVLAVGTRGAGDRRCRPLQRRRARARAPRPTSSSRSPRPASSSPRSAIGMTPALLPWGLLADRAGRARACSRSDSASPTVALAGWRRRRARASSSSCSPLSRSACGERKRGERPRRDALVRAGASEGSPSGSAVERPDRRPLRRRLRYRRSRPRQGLTWTYTAARRRLRAAAAAGALLLRSPAQATATHSAVSRGRPGTLRRPALWLVSCGSALFLFAQTATMSFTVLFLS